LSLLLECALFGKADAVVIGDKEILNLKNSEGIKIMSLKKYLKG
jgi:predicted nucleic acid-binding protein